MMSPSFHKLQYERLGYTIFAESLSNDRIAEFHAKAQGVEPDELVAGDESPHAWRELNLNVTRLPFDDSFVRLLSIVLSGVPTRATSWFNIYSADQYIDSHLDAGGEAQLMVPIQLPPCGSGGEFWLGVKDKVIPLSLGDALLFAAHRIEHGTNELISGQRISLNVRLWMQ